MAIGASENPDTSHEYMVLYTVDGRGYTDTKPWIDAKTDDQEEALQDYRDMVSWSKTQQGHDFEIWLEVREVGPWQRVDTDSLDC